MLIEQWRVHYNTVRPHSSLKYRLPAPDVVLVRRPEAVTRPDPSGSPAQERRVVYEHLAWITQWGLVTLETAATERKHY